MIDIQWQKIIIKICQKPYSWLSDLRKRGEERKKQREIFKVKYSDDLCWMILELQIEPIYRLAEIKR